MATRLYVPTPGGTGDVTPGISPAYDSSWEVTSSAVRLAASTTKTGTGGTNTIDGLGSGSNPNDVLLAQWIYGPLAPQTIGGFVKAMAAGREFNTGTNAYAQFLLKCVALNGVTVLTTLISHNTGAISSEWPNGSAESFRFPRGWTGSGTAVAATLAAPFYVVAEWGARIGSTDTTNAARVVMRNDGPSGDMGETEGVSSGAFDPWLEFSQTLLTYSPRNRGVTVADVGATTL